MTNAGTMSPSMSRVTSSGKKLGTEPSSGARNDYSQSWMACAMRSISVGLAAA